MKNKYFFYGIGCPHCVKAEESVDILIKEGFNIIKLEVWENKENDELMMSLDKGEDSCGGVPFFLNENNNKTICGEATIDEIRKWAN